MDPSIDERHNPVAGRNTVGDGARIGPSGGDLFGFGADHLNE